MATNYFKWEGMRRGKAWEKRVLLILSAVVFASGAYAYDSYHRHTVAEKLVARGEKAWCAGRITEAEREFTKALAADPYFFSARDQLAIVVWHRGNWDRSIALLREGTRLHPNSYAAHRALGETLFLARDYAGAIPPLERAEQLEPTKPGRPSLLNTCRLAVTDLPKAKRSAHKWMGLRTRSVMHQSGRHDGCRGAHGHAKGADGPDQKDKRQGTGHTD